MDQARQIRQAARAIDRLATRVGEQSQTVSAARWVDWTSDAADLLRVHLIDHATLLRRCERLVLDLRDHLHDLAEQVEQQERRLATLGAEAGGVLPAIGAAVSAFGPL